MSGASPLRPPVSALDAEPPVIDWFGRRPEGRARRGAKPMKRRTEPIWLLEADPDLVSGLTGAQRALAARDLVVPGVRVPAGPWTPPVEFERAVAVLIVDGLLLHSTRSYGLCDVRLHGPGDLFDATSLRAASGAWRVLCDARVALLDARVVVASRRWPQIVQGLSRRLFEGERRQHRLASVRALPRVDRRLLALLSDLALRWGHVTPGGLVVTLPATHQLLGQLVGARRPTVSLALTGLKAEGLLDRLDDGRWLLPAGCATWEAAGLPAPACPLGT